MEPTKHLERPVWGRFGLPPVLSTSVLRSTSGCWVSLLVGLPLVIGALSWAPPLQGQSGSAAGIAGRVVDPSGRPLQGVSVAVAARTTGYRRRTETRADGFFQLAALPVDQYTLEASLSGFSTVSLRRVRVRVASERFLKIALRPVAMDEVDLMTDVAPLVPTAPSLGTVVGQEGLKGVPLNGRQFVNLGILTAGTILAFNPDPSKAGQRAIALNGGIGRNVNHMIDGGDNTDDTIDGALQNFSLEGIAEFRIETQQYKAEYGRSTGGVLNVVTQAGTNDYRGSAYGFFSDEELTSRTETAKRTGADEQPFSQKQFGVAIGGPIAKNRAGFFAAFEKSEQDSAYTISTGGVLPDLDARSVPLDATDELFTAKLTAHLPSAQTLRLRFGSQDRKGKSGARPTVAPDALGSLRSEAWSLLAGYTRQLGSGSVNELTLQFSDSESRIAADSRNPTIHFPSGVLIGQGSSLPQATNQEKLQIRDDFLFSTPARGRQVFKAGVEFINEPVLGGHAASPSGSVFARLGDHPSAPVSHITVFDGLLRFSTPNDQWRAYVQDDWYVTNRLVLNLGLRYEYTDVLSLDQRSNPIWQTLSTQTEFDEYYLQDFQGGQGSVIEPDDDDLAPRFGFAWDIVGRGTHLLRGGWGLFYGFPYTNATVLFPAAAVQSDFGVAFAHTDPRGIRHPGGGFLQPGDPLPANPLSDRDGATPNDVASPTLSTPYARQLSVGYAYQINPWFAFNVEAVHVRYKDLPFRFRANPLVDLDGDGVGDRRRFPDLGDFRLWYGKGRADYDALNLTVQGYVSQRFEFQAFYTLSEAESNVLAGADEFRLTDAAHQPDLGGSRKDASVEPLDPLCQRCFGPTNTDARHRVTVSGVYFAPAGIRVSGIWRWRDALPFMVHAGEDLNGDGFPLDLPPGVPHVNSARGASFSQLDVRVSRVFTPTARVQLELIGEVFNLFNEKNPAGFVGALDSSRFGEPTAFAGDPGQWEQRLARLGLRVQF